MIEKQMAGNGTVNIGTLPSPNLCSVFAQVLIQALFIEPTHQFISHQYWGGTGTESGWEGLCSLPQWLGSGLAAPAGLYIQTQFCYLDCGEGHPGDGSGTERGEEGQGILLYLQELGMVLSKGDLGKCGVFAWLILMKRSVVFGRCGV